EYEDEEQLRKRAAEPHHLAGTEALPPGKSGNVEAGPVDELLEHQRVLRLLDDLVVGVAELGRSVRQPQRELEQPALEHALELETDLGEGGDHVKPDAGAHRLRLVAIPARRTEHIVGRQLPARIFRIDLELRVVPRNVGVGVEVLDDRLVAEARDQLRIALLAPSRVGAPALLLGDFVGGVVPWRGGNRHDGFSSCGMTRRASALAASRTRVSRSVSVPAMRSSARPSSKAKMKCGAISKNGSSLLARPHHPAKEARNIVSRAPL